MAVEICTIAHLWHLVISAREWSWKKYLLLTCQVLGLFANILGANDKYPVLNRVNLTIPVEIQFPHKQKPFSQIFCSFLNSSLNLTILKQKMTLIDFVFPRLQFPKTWLGKCLKSHVWEVPSTRNMVNGTKHCSNLHPSNFIISIDYC